MVSIVLYSISFGVLSFLKIEDTGNNRRSPDYSTGRPLLEIVMQPEYIVAVICGMLGYAVMSFVMTATPLAMDQAEFLFDDTAVVIQWHVMAMFAPSFFTGNLIVRFGVLRIMFAGAVFGLACVVINLVGTGFLHFLFALVFLGLSWNFLFVGATTLIADTYRPEERNKAQAVNDFLVFTTVSLGSLSSGALQNAFGWQTVNQGALLPLLVIVAAIAWLSRYRLRLAI